MNTRILQVISIPSGNQDKNKSLVLLMVKRMMVRSMLWIWLAKHWCTSEWFLQITNTQMHKYTNAQIHKCTNSQMHKCTNTQIHKCRELYRMGGAMLRLRPGEPWCDKCVTLYAGSALGKCDRSVGIAFRGVEPFVYFLFVYLCIICVLVYLTSGNCFQTWWTFTSSGTLRSC